MDKPQKEVTPETGLTLGILIISVLVFLLILVFILGFPELHSVKQGPVTVATAIYMQFWGILFLLSYFFPHKCFFFRGLIWICENFSHPRGKAMAFFYFALAFGLGTFTLLIGVGLVDG